MEEWILPLATTLLATIACFVFYFGVFQEVRKTSREDAAGADDNKNKVKVDKESVDAEATDVKISGERHLYMEADTRTRDLILLYRQQLQSQSSMQLCPERQEERMKTVPGSSTATTDSKTTTGSAISKITTASSLSKNTIGSAISKTTSEDAISMPAPGTIFTWPRQSVLLDNLPTNSFLDSELEAKLKDCGILRKVETEQEEQGSIEGAARACGWSLTKKQIRLTFDTFMAQSRPGLESDEEVKQSPKPKKNKNKNNTKNKKEYKNWHDDKENKTIKTSGWDNPAWKTACSRLIKPDSGASLVRAF